MTCPRRVVLPTGRTQPCGLASGHGGGCASTLQMVMAARLRRAIDIAMRR